MGFVCKGAYHGPCFQQGCWDHFPVLLLQDLNNSLVDDINMTDADPTCLKKGRGDNHFMVPFQCDTCHFVNIQGRLPRALDEQDELILLTIQRVLLDSLWTRERSTVSANMDEGARFVKNQARSGVSWNVMPQRGPYRKLDN